jgi:hypothetical protein
MVAAILSGATGLGYELVWCRMFASGLGAETPAVLAALAAFLQYRISRRFHSGNGWSG